MIRVSASSLLYQYVEFCKMIYKWVFVVILIGAFVYNWAVIFPQRWFRPRIGDTTDFVKSQGYPIQFHQVQTEDGYILGLHRIPHGLSNQQTKESRHPILLVHGLLMSSIDWVILGPKKSIGLILADEGYDVWMANTRGNTYSRNHVLLNPNENRREFFNFSYHEIGLFDLPAMIDYVLNETGYEKLSYIGFSQGVTSFMVMGSLRPDYNDKIRLMNAFAPVTNSYRINNIYFNILARFPSLLKVANLMGWYELFDSNSGAIFRLICQIKPVCNMFFRTIGLSKEQLPDHEFQLKALSNFPSGMSLRQITHFVQGTRTGMFAPLDSLKASYDLRKVTAPIILYYGEDDDFVNNEGLFEVKKQLRNATAYKVPYPKFNHLDFLWGRNIQHLTDETLKFNRLSFE